MKIVYTTILCLFFIFSTNASAAEAHAETGMLERMMMLVFQLGVIIFVARFGGILFEKLHMPAILGELVGGMLIGPYFLGGIYLPALGAPLFPLHKGFPISCELYGFATVASIILLFLVGVETDLKMFLKYSVAGSIVGLGGVIVSFILGNLVTVVFSKYVFGAQYSFTHPLPMFLGAVSTATSVGITARILSERKKMQSPEGVTIVSGAIIDDVLGIIVLAIIIGIVRSGHVEWKTIGLISIKYVGLWLLFTIAGLMSSRAIGNFLKSFKEATSITVMGLGLALILAGVFERAGLAMIIGAYIMGLSISRTDLRYLIQERLSVLYSFFVPSFFCVMGMLVDFSSMSSRHVLVFGLVYTIVSIAAKIIGCGLPVLFLNFNLRGAIRVGLGMIPRGEVALIITGVGIATGILPAQALGVVIAMIFITTLVAPALLSAVLRSDKPVLRKQPPAQKEHRHLSFTMPSAETSDLVLSKVVSEFMAEGYYVHRISSQERFYQIQKESISISMKADSQQLQFDCREDEEVFITTLVYEVLTGLENTMKQLQTLVDKATIGRRIFDKHNGVALRKGKLKENITFDTVKIDLKGNTKREIIEELLDLLIAAGRLDMDKRQLALDDLLKREEIMSTGMQDGIALPHAKTDAVQRMATAVGLKVSGVDFQSLDGKPSQIFVIILAPKDAVGPHIRFMADISQVLIDKGRREAIIACETNRQLYEMLVS